VSSLQYIITQTQA